MQYEKQMTKIQEIMYKLSKKFNPNHTINKYFLLLFIVLSMGFVLAGIFSISSSINMYVMIALIVITFLISINATSISFSYYPIFLAPFWIRLMSVIIGFLSLYSFLFFFTILNYKIFVINPIDLFRVLSGSYYTYSSIFGLAPRQLDISVQLYYSLFLNFLFTLWVLFGIRRFKNQETELSP